jgi:hypothetical protein
MLDENNYLIVGLALGRDITALGSLIKTMEHLCVN